MMEQYSVVGKGAPENVREASSNQPKGRLEMPCRVTALTARAAPQSWPTMAVIAFGGTAICHTLLLFGSFAGLWASA